jgi:ribose 5-phosphate isomerase RpiB
MTIYFATDHAGFTLKEKVKKFLSDDSNPIIIK